MTPKERPGRDPFKEFEMELQEYDKELERELNMLALEYESILRAYDKMAAAFSDISNAKDYLDFERKLKKYERLSNEFDRISRPGYASSEADSSYEHDEKSEDSDLSGAWIIKITTYTVPRDFLRLLAIRKEIEEEIAREDKELGLDI